MSSRERELAPCWLEIYTTKRWSVNSSPPEQNGRQFADDIFKCIFVNEKFCILLKISVKFVPKGPIGLDNGLVPNRHQAIIWTNADVYIHWCIYAALGWDELTKIMVYINRYDHGFLWDIIAHPGNWTAVKVRARMSNYIPLLYVDAITYPCPNPMLF